MREYRVNTVRRTVDVLRERRVIRAASFGMTNACVFSTMSAVAFKTISLRAERADMENATATRSNERQSEELSRVDRIETVPMQCDPDC
jgi:hypothetical protein